MMNGFDPFKVIAFFVSWIISMVLMHYCFGDKAEEIVIYMFGVVFYGIIIWDMGKCVVKLISSNRGLELTFTIKIKKYEITWSIRHDLISFIVSWIGCIILMHYCFGSRAELIVTGMGMIVCGGLILFESVGKLIRSIIKGNKNETEI